MAGYDAIIIGLGVMGSSVLRSAAARGLRVLGLDRREPPHALGSSHGRARMIREAYFEHPLYVPLVRRAYRLWEALERESGIELLRITRGAFIGAGDGELVTGALASSERHGIPVEIVDGKGLQRAFPAFAGLPDVQAVVESRAGYLLPSACIGALIGQAVEHAAETRVAEVSGWRRHGGGLRVSTDRGEYVARSLVLAAGPWISGLSKGVRLPLSVERVIQLAIAPHRPDRHARGVLPVFAWEYEPGRVFYGFPLMDGVLKVGLHHGEPVSDPGEASREVTEAETRESRRLVRKLLPAADGPLAEADVCFYTRTPDGHFLIDRLPGFGQVVVVSACSGHGFKFAPAIGEIVTDLLTDTVGEFDIEPFSIARFAG